MKKNKKIAIIGHFGGNKNFLDGQTVKTKILYNELKNATNWKIKKVDTYYKKHNPIKLLIDTIVTLFLYKDIMILLSRNGMKIYFPLLYYMKNIFRFRVYHDVIGGNLDKYISENPKCKKYLNSFKCNWVETEGLKKKLEKQEILNCEVIPNFKRLNVISENEIDNYDINKNIYKFCTFSRVMKEKGISDAIDVINKLNYEKNNGFVYQLDIYGPIDSNYEKEFKNKLKTSDDNIKYCGEIPFDKSVDILKNYDILLFPTYWDGEGFPGTIIDSFSAGVPVIATDWNCNSEIVKNNVNGIILSKNNVRNLEEAINNVIDNKEQIIKMKLNCIKSAQKYMPDKYVEIIKEKIEDNK